MNIALPCLVDTTTHAFHQRDQPRPERSAMACLALACLALLCLRPGSMQACGEHMRRSVGRTERAFFLLRQGSKMGRKRPGSCFGFIWGWKFGFSTLHRGIGEFGSLAGYYILFFIPMMGAVL